MLKKRGNTQFQISREDGGRFPGLRLLHPDRKDVQELRHPGADGRDTHGRNNVGRNDGGRNAAVRGPVTDRTRFLRLADRLFDDDLSSGFLDPLRPQHCLRHDAHLRQLRNRRR